jgi:hypothetical protein
LPGSSGTVPISGVMGVTEPRGPYHASIGHVEKQYSKRARTSSRSALNGRKKRGLMSDHEVVANQKTILHNQATILENQKTILHHQGGIEKNQRSLDQILLNQKEILANQKEILENQHSILAVAK